jgi:hypothetical protein
VIAGLRRGGVFDTITRLLAVIGHAVPTFWFGLVFILVFAVNWRIFPSGKIASLGAADFDLGVRGGYPVEHDQSTARTQNLEPVQEGRRWIAQRPQNVAVGDDVHAGGLERRIHRVALLQFRSM